MKYNISGHVYISKEIEAENLEEVLKEFKKRHPHVRMESIDWNDGEEGYDVAGICESCEKVLLYDKDHFYSDWEGCLICENCYYEESDFNPDSEYGRAG